MQQGAGKVNYSRYIKSPAWRRVRAKVLARSKGWCERCRTERALHVHHVTYARLGNEALNDLEALCAGCHVKEHPDKVSLQGAFLGDSECECGSNKAEIYVGDDDVFAVCIECGEVVTRKRRPHSRRNNRPRKRRTTEQQAADLAVREQKALAANMRKMAARIDRRHGRGGKAFGSF